MAARCFSLLQSVHVILALQSLAKWSQEEMQRKQTRFFFKISIFSSTASTLYICSMALLVDDAPACRVSRRRTAFGLLVVWVEMGFVDEDLFSKAWVPRRFVFQLYDQVRVASFKRQFLNERGKFGEWWVVHYRILLLVAVSMLLPSPGSRLN